MLFGMILTGSMDTYIDWESGECSFDGEALLLKLRLSEIYDICKAELIFGEKDVAYIGFPVDGECGTVIRPSYPMLAISIGSEYFQLYNVFLEEAELPLRRRQKQKNFLNYPYRYFILFIISNNNRQVCVGISC